MADKAKLFEYAAIWNPPQTKDAQGNDTSQPAEIVVKPDWILAKNDKEVAMKVARLIPEQFVGSLDEVDIIIRPFN